MQPCFHWLAGLALATGLSSAAQAADPVCSLAHPAGRYSLTLNSGGQERQAIYYVPYGYSGQQRLPLVLDLHGSESNAAEQLDRGQWEAEAQARGLAVVAPQGVLAAGKGFRWNVPGVTPVPAGTAAPDDERFISDVIDAVSAKLCVDARRVYATGYSGGARMVAQYACDVPGRLAAVGLVAGIRAGTPRKNAAGAAEPDPASCKPARPVPVIAFASTADKVNPFDGGGAPYWQYGGLAAQARWGEINGCQSGPETRRITAETQLISYEACDQQARVLLYLTADTGHAWPGSRVLLATPSVLTPVPFDIEATPLMWRFFEPYRLRLPQR